MPVVLRLGEQVIIIVVKDSVLKNIIIIWPEIKRIVGARPTMVITSVIEALAAVNIWDHMVLIG